MAAARIAKHSVRILAVLALLACRGLSADVGASNALLRIAFGAGLDLNKPQPIWEAIAAAQPSLFILLGDVHPNIAGAAPTGSIFSACEGLRRIASLCPVMVIWSDRDLEPTADTTNVLDRTKLQTRFMDLLAEPLDSPRRNRPGVYDSRILGLIGRQTQIILLDTCSFRTPPVKQASPPPGDGPYEALDDRTATLLGSN